MGIANYNSLLMILELYWIFWLLRGIKGYKKIRLILFGVEVSAFVLDFSLLCSKD